MRNAIVFLLFVVGWVAICSIASACPAVVAPQFVVQHQVQAIQAVHSAPQFVVQHVQAVHSPVQFVSSPQFVVANHCRTQAVRFVRQRDFRIFDGRRDGLLDRR